MSIEAIFADCEVIISPVTQTSDSYFRRGFRFELNLSESVEGLEPQHEFLVIEQHVCINSVYMNYQNRYCL